MRYHIDTIPLWDAMKADSECLLCTLRRRMELDAVEKYLGASVMEPDTRIEVNRRGFCTHHLGMMFQKSNKLGIALMMESHLHEVRSKAKKAIHHMVEGVNAYADASLLGKISSKGRNAKATIASAAHDMQGIAHGCMICHDLDSHMARYRHTFFHLYKTDGEFRAAYAASKGSCLIHTAELLQGCAEALPAPLAKEFAAATASLWEKHIQRTEDDLQWFIKKFDYRYDQEPWKNSQDAVERTVNKLRSWCVGKEPFPEE